MNVKQVPSCPVSIFIAGDCAKAVEECRAYCDEAGYCVTVTPTTYVYRDGQDSGVIIGLINYPRFPADLDTIAGKAIALAKRLRVKLGQESFSVQTPETTTWCSWRDERAAQGMPLEEPRPQGSGASAPASPVRRMRPNDCAPPSEPSERGK